MSGDPLADLIATTIWSREYKGHARVAAPAAKAAGAVRAWIVEQIDHERCYWELTDAAALDGLQSRIEDGAA